MSHWQPKREDLAILMERIGENLEGQIIVGRYQITWGQLIDEILAGTSFGREYFTEFVQRVKQNQYA